MAERKIVQIMPADGWAAVFTEAGDELISPLAGWALVQNGESGSAVVGLVAWEQVQLCDDQPNFVRYIFMSDFLLDEDEDYGDGLDAGAGDELPYDPKTGLLN